MRRLIDADLLMEKLNVFNDREHGNEHFLYCIETAKELLEDAPTAYDVDKVVEQLEKDRVNFESRGILPLVNMDYAVEVVRNGGKE